MLQEILLSLSGFPSPIWDQAREDGQGNGLGVNQYISSPEKAMLATFSQLSTLHIKIRELASQISSTHPSTICRVIAASILNKHCYEFREKIVQVECDILQKDAAYVGGYDIVPLSTVLGEFMPWLRRLEWLLAVLDKIVARTPPDERTRGIVMLDYLEKETHTGYVDIERIAVHLLTTAQAVWMRYLSTWTLYGSLPPAPNEDFFIHPDSDASFGLQGVLKDDLQPAFVTVTTANAVIGIGNALNQLRLRNRVTSDPVLALLPAHLTLLQSLQLPLNSVLLEKAVLSINDSVSRNALSQILPLHEVVQLMQVIFQYLLLNRGEFASTLVKTAVSRIEKREHSQAVLKHVRKVGRLDHLRIQEAETDVILNETWSELSALQADNSNEDSIFELAKTIIKLQLSQDQKLLSTLLPTPSALTFSLKKQSTLTLILDKQSIELYQTISSYLLSLRRSSTHLSDLWKLSVHRRTFPAPQGPPHSGTTSGQRTNHTRRTREMQRRTKSRKHWATVSKALFTINELDAYLHGEVIKHNYDTFRAWLDAPNTRPSSAKSETFKPGTDHVRDPRSLANAHKTFLNALYAGLLLSHAKYLEALRTLLSTIDHFIALFTRLQTVWQGLDLQEDEGVLDAFSNYVQDEEDVLAEMARTRTTLETELAEVVAAIQGAEQDQNVDVVGGSIASLELGEYNVVSAEDGRYRPGRKRTIDRLIMKLDFVDLGRDTGRNEVRGLLDVDDE